MLGTMSLGPFVLACVALCVTPCARTIYVLTRALVAGRNDGVASVVGLAAGQLVYAVASALVLAAILAISDVVFALFKMAGNAYLIYLGVRAIMRRGAPFTARLAQGQRQAEAELSRGVVRGRQVRLSPLESFLRPFSQSALVVLRDPWVLLFDIAFLPHFASATGFAPLPFMLLGLVFALVLAAWGIAAVMLAEPLADLLASNDHLSPALDVAVGVIFIVLGVGLFITR